MNGRKQKKRGFHRWPRHHALPPHSWESQPAAKQGEVNKRLVVIIISIVAVVLLLLLLFFGAKFVGKAIALPSGTGGATSTLAIPQAAGTEILVPIGVNLPSTKESVAWELELKYSQDVLDFVRLDSLVPWDNSFQRLAAGANTVRLERATLNFTDAIEGSVTVAEAVFRVRPGQQLTTSKSINITTLNVFDLGDSNVNLVQNIVQLSGAINPSVAEPTLAFDFTSESTLALTLLLPSGTEIYGWYFELMSPTLLPDNTLAVNICAGNITQFPWNEFPEQGCVDGILRAGDATLTNFKAEAVTLAELTFPLPAAGTSIIFNFQKMDVYDQNGNDIFPAGQDFTLIVPQPSIAPICGDSIVQEKEECDGSDFAGKNCETYLGAGAGGTLLCDSSNDPQPCTIDGSDCLEPPECTAGQTQQCGIQVGICIFGQQSCANGAWGACTGGIIPVEETCDGLDNDCDGSPDEGCPLTLSSPAFGKGEVLPVKYTCEANVPAKNPTPALPTNPPLLISNMPQGTESLALFLEDADQPKQGRPVTVHWAVYNIPVPPDNPATAVDESRTVVIPENYPGSTLGILQAQNDVTQQQNYAPPCPPAGASHQYYFKAYALRVSNIVNTLNINLQNILTATAFADKASGNVIQDAALISYYPTKPAAPSAAAPAAGGGGSGGGGEVRGGGLVGWNCPKDWSSCINGQEQRTCQDMFAPSITRLESRPCVVPVATPPAPKPAAVTLPAKPVVQPPASPKPIAITPPPSAVTAPVVQKPLILLSLLFLAKNLWQNYKVYVVAVPSALLVVITLILLIHHFRKPKVVYNVEELKGWIKAEKAMGTSDENVKAILAQNTGWSKEEIETALQDALGVSPETSPGASPALPPAMPPTS